MNNEHQSINYSQTDLIIKGKKGVKWDINYNFSEKTTMIFVAKTVLYEAFIGKI
jgi:hypothetical protein